MTPAPPKDVRVLVVGSYGVAQTYTVRRAPGPGETVLADSFQEESGGKGSNQAVQAARLGADVEILTALGADRHATTARLLWEREGVGHRLVPSVGPTMTASVVVDAEAENRIVVCPGALAAVDGPAVRAHADAFARADICVVQLEVPADGAAAALRLARQHRTPTVLNPSPAPSLEVWAELGGLADHLVVNVHEARVLAAEPQEAPDGLATRLADDCGATVVVTVGEDGAWVAGPRSPARHARGVPAVAVDTTGAGDAFTGAYAVALARRLDPYRSAVLACRAGAAAVRRRGVIDALPHRADISDGGSDD